MKVFGINEYGNKDGFEINCKECGKSAWAVPTHHYNEKRELEKITLEFRCTCGNRYGVTIH